MKKRQKFGTFNTTALTIFLKQKKSHQATTYKHLVKGRREVKNDRGSHEEHREVMILTLFGPFCKLAFSGC